MHRIGPYKLAIIAIELGGIVHGNFLHPAAHGHLKHMPFRWRTAYPVPDPLFERYELRNSGALHRRAGGASKAYATILQDICVLLNCVRLSRSKPSLPAVQSSLCNEITYGV